MKSHSMFQIILLAIFGALGAAGVMIFALAVGGNQSATDIGKVVLWGTFDKTAFGAAFEKAMAVHPELQQVTYVHKDESTYEQALSEALAQSAGPDLFILRSDYAIKDAPKIQPLTSDQLTPIDFQGFFAEGANVYVGPQGVFAVPFLIDPMVLYWNRDILSGAGYAEPPKYWEDVVDMASRLTVRDPGGSIKTAAIALGTYQNIGNAKSDLSLLLLQKGVKIVRQQQTGALAPALSSQGAAAGAPHSSAEALAFYTSFADPSQNNYSWSGAMQDARTSFAAGDVALYIGFASEASLITAMNPNLNFAIADMPQFKNAKSSANFGRVYAFAVPRVAKNQRGAYMAAQFLDEASTTAIFARALGIASARRSVLSLPSQGYGTLFNRMAILARTWPDPDPAQTDGLFRAMIEGTVSGASSVDQSIERGDQQMAQIIGQ